MIRLSMKLQDWQSICHLPAATESAAAAVYFSLVFQRILAAGETLVVCQKSPKVNFFHP